MAHVDNKICEDAQGLGCDVRSGWFLKVMKHPGLYIYQGPALPSRAIVISRPEILLRSMSGSEALKQQGFVLISMAPANTNGYKDTWVLINHLKQC